MFLAAFKNLAVDGILVCCNFLAVFMDLLIYTICRLVAKIGQIWWFGRDHVGTESESLGR